MSRTTTRASAARATAALATEGRKVAALIIVVMAMAMVSAAAQDGDYELFKRLYAAGDYRAALPYIERAARAAPADPDRRYWLGLTRYQLGAFAEAAATLLALPVDYRTWPARSYAIDCLARTGRVAEALARAREVIDAGLPLGDRLAAFWTHFVKHAAALKDHAVLSAYEECMLAWFTARGGGHGWYAFTTASCYLDAAVSAPTTSASGTLFRRALALAARGMEAYDGKLLLHRYPLALLSAGDLAGALETAVILEESVPPYRKSTASAPADGTPNASAAAWVRGEALRRSGRDHDASATWARSLGAAAADPAFGPYVFSSLSAMLPGTLVDETGLAVAAGLAAFIHRFDTSRLSAAALDTLNLARLRTARWLAERHLASMPGPGGRMDARFRLIDAVSSGGFGRYDDGDDARALTVYEAAARFWSGFASRPAPYVQGFLTLCFARLEVPWDGAEGGIVANALDPELPALFDREFETFRRLVYYLTGGAVLPENRTVLRDGTVRGMDRGTWTGSAGAGDSTETIDYVMFDPSSVSPYPGRLLLDSLADTDVFVFVAPTEGLPSAGLARRGRLELVPGFLYGPERAQVFLSSRSAARHTGLLHEWYHTMEAGFDRYGPRLVRHAYKEAYHASWPAWYSGEGELVYYREALERLIEERGVAAFSVRSAGDGVDLAAFMEAAAAHGGTATEPSP